MELKVWVDGIQRVVCGASYTTTCQDVVLALAHAMGRTGRFTLVEKWRDSERPLTPGECPLQALHKWGEYAAEVRFYLVQAETEKVKNKSQNQQRPKTPTEKLDTFSHNFSPPTPQYQSNQMSNTDSLKRSSTFSGAHNQYATFPSSSLSSSMSATLSGYNRSQQPPVQPPPSSNAKVRRTTQSSLPNGEMASTSSSGSSPRSSSRTSPRGLPPGYTSRGNIPAHYPSAPHPSNAYRGDARELHPANMPEASSSYSNQGSDYSSRRPHPSHTGPPYSVPSQQAYSAYSQPAAVGHPHTKQPQQPYPSSFDQKSSHPSVPSSYHRPPPQQHTQPLPSGKPYSSQHLRPPSSHEPYSQSGASQPQQPYIQSGGPQPPPSHPVPAPRHQRPPSPSAEYENLPPYNRGRQRPSSRDPPHPVRRERSRDRSLPRAMPSNQANTGGFYQEDNRGGIDSAYREELPRRPSSNPNQFQGFGKENRPGDYPVQKDRNLLGHPDNRNANQSSQGRGRPADAFKHPSDCMPAAAQPSTRSRSMPEPQASKGLPTRSVSSYDTAARDDGGLRHSGDKPLSKSMPASGMNLLRQSGEANKISFVDSALHRQQKSSTDSNQSGGSKGGGGGMSSFASAVAHLRQHSGEGQHLKPVKTETHVRQHSSDSSRTDESFKGGLGNTGRNFSASGGGNSVGVNNMRSFSTESDHQQKENVQRLHPPSNQPLSSFTSPRPGSAFTQVSPRTSRQGSSSSPSSAPVAYNLDHQNLNQFRSGVSSAETDNHLKQESSHSRQASLEIEEYDLDQNFPDVLQREASAGMSGRVDRRYNVPMEYHLDNGGVAPAAPAQVETEYLQLMRLVKMQQEKIKVQEAQISEATAEISSLEEKESQDNAQLEVITGQLSQLEQQEAEVKVALEDLERVEWVNVLDGERKREADFRLQMKNTQGKVEQLDSQLKQLKEEEEKKGQEVKAELDKLEKEKKQNEELEKKTTEELNNLRNKLAALNKEVEEKGKKLEDIEEMIQKAENDMKKQVNSCEEEAKSIEEELKDENMKDFQAHPVPKEPPPTSVAGQAPVVPPAPLTVISSTDDGEAILKLLEGRLSPRTPPISPTADGSDANVEGITSAQHTYKSALAAKNPNGVWV